MTDLIVLTDRDYRCLYLNPAAERRFGPQTGAALWTLPAGLRAHKPLLDGVLQHEQAAHFEQQLSDGHWYAVSAYPSAAGLLVVFQRNDARQLVETRQRPPLRHTYAVLLSLSRIATRIGTAQGVAPMLEALDHELQRLRMHAVILLHEPQTRTFAVRYVALPENTLRLIQKTAGVDVRSLRFGVERVPALFKLLSQPQPLIIGKLTERVARCVPDVPAALLKRLLRLSRVGAHAGLFVLPLSVKQQLLGVLLLWGLPLERTDLPALNIFASQLAALFENARLYDELQRSRAHLQHLSHELLSAQEEERLRLSRELHDEAGQSLTALAINLKLLSQELDDEVRQQRLAELSQLTSDTTEMLRALAHRLRPPALDTFGLHATLDNHCRDFARHTNLTIRYEGVELGDVPAMHSITLYRLTQEALNNVAKHAQASEAHVQLAVQDGTLLLSITDNGVGFQPDATQSGKGLMGARERIELAGGTLQIESADGQGTRLVARLPWKEQA